MNRKEKLLKIFENVDEDKKILVEQTIEEVLFLEEQLKELKKYPFIKIHPTDVTRQKPTPAGKQYKEFMQSYLNALKVLNSVVSRDTFAEEDDFDKWIKEAKGL